MRVSRVVRAQNLARYLVDKYKLEPPVPIEELLAAVADVREEAWPHEDVDAIVPSLGRQRPTVYVRQGAPHLRARFTLAHEFGHIKMLWHQGRRSCKIAGANLPGDVLNDEQEADLFASLLMAPDAWLQSRHVQHANDMPSLLSSLGELELSAVASIRALRRVLMAGWAFRLSHQTYGSAGTDLVIGPGSSQWLDDHASDSGAVQLQGRTVRWYRLFDDLLLPADDDPRETTEILRDVLRSAVEGGDSLRNVQRVNGKVGGGLSRLSGTAESNYHSLVYRFESDADPEIRNILQYRDLHLFLARRAKAKADGTTKRQR